MISRKTLRIAGAAILGTLMGTGPAHAIVELPAGETDGDLAGVPSFANETLVSKVGTTEYDSITGFSNNLALESDLGLRINLTSGTIVRVSYGFGEAYRVNADLTDTSLVLITTADSDVTPGAATVSISRITGGTAGDAEVTYSISGGTTGVDCTAAGTLSATGCRVRLLLPSIGLNSDGDGASGTITMMASVVIGGETFRSTRTFTDPIKTVVALSESVTPSTTPPRATVDTGFEMFDGGNVGVQTVALGTIQLGVKNGADGDTVVSTNQISAAPDSFNPVRLLTTNGAIATSGTISFAGDLSFVTDVFRTTDSTCPASGLGTGGESLVEGTDTKTWKTAISVADFESEHTICLRTDGMTVIPASTYMVTTNYVGLSNAAYPPVGDTHTLGRITRDGTNVHIPYLSTFGPYNHRIVMRNRGSRDARYMITFDGEADVTPTSRDGATGTVPAGGVVVVRARDAVEISGGSRVAASVNIEGAPTVIDVATVQTNTTNGSTDTVRYSATQSVVGASTH